MGDPLNRPSQPAHVVWGGPPAPPAAPAPSLRFAPSRRPTPNSGLYYRASSAARPPSRACALGPAPRPACAGRRPSGATLARANGLGQRSCGPGMAGAPGSPAGAGYSFPPCRPESARLRSPPAIHTHTRRGPAYARDDRLRQAGPDDGLPPRGLRRPGLRGVESAARAGSACGCAGCSPTCRGKGGDDAHGAVPAGSG